MSIHAWRTSGKGTLQVVEEALPPLGPQDVRFRVLAVSLNFRDKAVIKGGWGRAATKDRVPLTDAVGVVTEIGPGVTRFRVGDRVCTTVMPTWIDGPLTEDAFRGSPGTRTTDGVLATHLQWHEDALVLAPVHLTAPEASTLTIAALTAWHAVVELGAVQAGDTVVVQTTGGVATFAIQFAVALGARVIVVSRSEAKLAKAKALGAIGVVDSLANPDWEREVMRLTEGQGARLVIDMGLKGGLARSTAATAYEGTIAIVGVVQTMSHALDIFAVMNGNLRVRGVETGSRAMFERMNRFMAERGLRPVIDQVHGVDRLDEALASLDGAPFGKVVVSMQAA